MQDLIRTVMLGIIVNRAFNGFSLFQKFQVLHQKFCLQGIRMVIIDGHTLFKRDPVLSAIIIIVIKNYHIISKIFFDPVGKCGFS